MTAAAARMGGGDPAGPGLADDRPGPGDQRGERLPVGFGEGRNEEAVVGGDGQADADRLDRPQAGAVVLPGPVQRRVLAKRRGRCAQQQVRDRRARRCREHRQRAGEVDRLPERELRYAGGSRQARRDRDSMRRDELALARGRHDRREHVVPLDPPCRPGSLNEIDVDPVLPRERTHDRRREYPALRPRRGADLLRRLELRGSDAGRNGRRLLPGDLLPGRPDPADQVAGGDHRARLVDDSDEDAGPGGLDLERRLVGLDLEQRLALADLVAHPLQPGARSGSRHSSARAAACAPRVHELTQRPDGGRDPFDRGQRPRPRAPARPAPARRSSRPA